MAKNLIFISHSSQDSNLARELAEALQRKGRSVWLDTNSLSMGEEWDTAIVRALDESRVALVLVSPQYLDSPSASFELGVALAKAAESDLQVVPVLTEEVDPAAMPRTLRRLQRLNIGFSPGGAEKVAEQLISQTEPGEA
jgi:TIR domain